MINSFRFSVLADFFLDVYSPLICMGLHQLNTSDSDLIRVRRDSDAAEADFNATEISDGTLVAWVGANNGFIAKWYNLGSSGSTNDLLMTTAASQPKIVDSSTGLIIDPDNSNAAMFFDGSDDHFAFSTGWTSVSTYSQIHIFNRVTAAVKTPSIASSTDAQIYSTFWYSDNATYFKPTSNSGAGWTGDVSTGDFLDFTIYVTPNVQCWRNSVDKGSKTHTAGTLKLHSHLGRRASDYLDGYSQFFCLFESDETSSRVDMQDNLNTALSIY